MSGRELVGLCDQCHSLHAVNGPCPGARGVAPGTVVLHAAPHTMGGMGQADVLYRELAAAEAERDEFRRQRDEAVWGRSQALDCGDSQGDGCGDCRACLQLSELQLVDLLREFVRAADELESATDCTPHDRARLARAERRYTEASVAARCLLAQFPEKGS